MSWLCMPWKTACRRADRPFLLLVQSLEVSRVFEVEPHLLCTRLRERASPEAPLGEGPEERMITVVFVPEMALCKRNHWAEGIEYGAGEATEERSRTTTPIPPP